MGESGGWKRGGRDVLRREWDMMGGNGLEWEGSERVWEGNRYGSGEGRGGIGNEGKVEREICGVVKN